MKHLCASYRSGATGPYRGSWSCRCRRAGNEDDAVRFVHQPLETPRTARPRTQGIESKVDRAAIKYTQHEALAVNGRHVETRRFEILTPDTDPGAAVTAASAVPRC